MCFKHLGINTQCLLNGRYMVSWMMNKWVQNDPLHQAECPEAIPSHVVSTVLVLFCFPYITLLGFEQKTIMIITLRWNQKLSFYNSGLKEQNLQFGLNRYQQEIPFRSSRVHILFRAHGPFCSIDHMLHHKISLNKFKRTEII